MKIKPAGKVLIGLLIAGGIFGGVTWWKSAPKVVGESATVGKVVIPDAPEASLSGTAAVKYELPSTTAASNGGLVIKWQQMAWNSQTGLNYANGGPRTTKGSLMDKAGIDMTIVRQDDCMQSCTDMAKYIQDYKAGNTKDGFFITFMGSGIPNFLNSIDRAVKELGPEYAPVAFLTFGKSYGEDQVMGPYDIKQNPQNMKGKVLRGVRLDGDIDLALKYAGDNGVRVNANEKLYDPEALNLSYGKDFLSVVVDYNQGLKETRKLVRNGKTAGDTTVEIDMVATWTPGDVNVMNGRKGVTIVSTRTYASIMPNITITCKKFLRDNATKLEDMVIAIAQAGDQVRSFDDVKAYATALNAKIWNEQDGKYWLKYYNGEQRDKNTYLGGSMVFNLADMAKMFGLNGNSDVYKEVYNTFGNLQSKLYPEDLPTIIPYAKAVDKSIINSVISNHPELLEGKALEVEYAAEISEKVSSKDVHINFETGSYKISQSSYATLNDIYSSAITGEGLKIGIYGHTDNVGDPSANRTLSENRANAIRDFLIAKGVPRNRLETKGYGEDQPIADNNTESGKAQNRRVQIVLGN